MNAEITESLVRRVIEIVDAGLVAGLGEPVPGKMCVEAAVCYALGLRHGDNPPCVAPAVRLLTIRLNDAYWSSPQARAKGLKRLAIAGLGSAGVLDEREFVRRVARLAIQTCVPATLRTAAQCCARAQRKRLLHAADLCERDPTRTNALEALDAATAADAAVASAAAEAAYAAAFAADAAYTYFYANAAASAADAARAAATYADADAEAHLSDFAEGVVQILIDMGAPGCAFLQEQADRVRRD